jgi:hypothetical protein
LRRSRANPAIGQQGPQLHREADLCTGLRFKSAALQGTDQRVKRHAQQTGQIVCDVASQGLKRLAIHIWLELQLVLHLAQGLPVHRRFGLDTISQTITQIAHSLPGLRAQGVDVADLQPANCGFNVQGRWSPLMQQRFAGSPLKNVGLHTTDAQGQSWQRKGECVVTQTGLEGSLVYAASQVLRETIARDGQARLWLDLLPDWPAEKVLAEVRHPRGSRSLSTHLKSRLHLDGVKAGLLFECLPKPSWSDAQAVAQAIKALPVVLAAPRPLDEAISSAGGVRLEALSEGLMLKAVPGVFAAGEMLDWEAPTGGYLLTACLASGQRAARGVLRYLAQSAANTVSTPV